MLKRGLIKENKKSLSTIVATLLIILLTLVAVGIIWIVVRNVLQGGSEQISLGKFTLDLKISQVQIINDSTSNITIKRNAGKGDFVGINFIFEDDINTETIKQNFSLRELETKSFQLIFSTINVSRLRKISIAPIYKLESGKEINGDIKDTYFVGVSGSGISTCTPSCPSGAMCGSDGCGGTCGMGCSGSTPNCINYQCSAQICTPSCLNRQCGSDGCTGSCGTCLLSNAVSSCSVGYQCTITSCNSGYSNCDSNISNGCETTLGTTSNCASCGNACLVGQTCTNNVCTNTQICVPECPLPDGCAFIKEVTQGSDDAEESLVDNAVSIFSSDLGMTYEGANQYIGMRFQSLNIPRGVRIEYAILEFECKTASSGPGSVTILGQDISNAPTFSDTSRNITNRILTSNFSSWVFNEGWIVGTKYNSSDLKNVMQEIIDRPDWSANNSIAIVINGSLTSEINSRSGKSYNEGTAVPKLYIKFTTCDEEPVACTDTCSSLGYNCGTRTICEVSANCGACSGTQTCVNNICRTNIQSLYLEPIWCGIHSMHTSYGDGIMTPAESAQTLRNRYDCGSTNEHDVYPEPLTQTEWTSMIDISNNYNLDNSFTYFSGIEWTSDQWTSTGQHIHYISMNPSPTPKYVTDSNFNTIAELVTWLSQNQGLAQINHPARTSQETDFSNPSEYNETWMPLVEIKNNIYYHWNYYWNCAAGSGCTTYENPSQPGQGASGTGWVKYALDNGVHMGFNCGNDYHGAAVSFVPYCYTGIPGITSLTRQGIYNELKSRHTWVSEEKTTINLIANNGIVNFTMGDIFTTTSQTITIRYSINATQGNTISNVSLFHNGIIVNVTNYAQQNITGSITRSLIQGQEDYLFIEAMQNNGKRAWTSPIWVTYNP